MKTVLELLQRSTDFLEKKGVPESRLNAELLLASVLHCKRLNLYLMFDRPLSDDETEKYRTLIIERSTRKPIQYILGKVEFFGMEFTVNESVLIPRPETELLVEQVIESAKTYNANTILDIGTGSGCIAIAAAKALPSVTVTAVDVSEQAIALAKQNATQNGMTENICFFVSDIIKIPKLSKKYDIIVSNPPYISAPDYSLLEPELTDYEPKIALTDDADGFTFYRKIISLAKKSLNPGGVLLFEIAFSQGEKVLTLMRENGFTECLVVKDYSNLDRIAKGIKSKQSI